MHKLPALPLTWKIPTSPAYQLSCSEHNPKSRHIQKTLVKRDDKLTAYLYD